MNKIYSKVWNASLGKLVVASELARTHGKCTRGASASRRPVHALNVLALAFGMTFAGAALAQSTDPGWNVQVNNEAPTEVASGDTLTLQEGQNILISRSGNVITVKTVGTPSFQGADMGGGKVTNVGNGTAGTDAVNKSQLDAVGAIADNANQGWNVQVNGDTASQVEPGQTVQFKDDGKNVVITRSGTDITVSLKDTPSFQGADMGGGKVTNVGNGAVASGSTDAVNGGQLHDVQQTANQGWNVQVNGAAGQNLGPGDTLNLKQGQNVLLSRSGNDITVKTVDTPSFQGASMGGERITGVGTGTSATDAVNKAQLDAVSDTANAGWDISAQGANQTNVASGDTVDLANSDGNIKVSKTTANNDVGFDLADNIAVTSVTAGNTTVDNNGLTITGGPEFTSSGIDADGLKITGVAAGDIGSGASTDAVNGGQLHAMNNDIAKALGTQLDGNGNLVQPEYEVSQAGGGTTQFDNVKDAIENITGANGGTGVGIKYFHAKSVLADSQAIGDDSIAIGPETVAEGSDALAAGHGASVAASSSNGTALGKGATVGTNSDSAVAIGNGAKTDAQADHGIAMGTAAEAKAANAVSVGHGASAGSGAVALGTGTSAAGAGAVGAGNGAKADAHDSMALGTGAQASTHDSISLGTDAGKGTVYKTPDDGKRHSHIAIGESAGQNVEGNETIAIGVGAGSGVENDYNVAIGSHAGTQIQGERNVALGYKANQQAAKQGIDHATAIGGLTQARSNAVALGYKAMADNGGVALGEGSGADSHGVAIGQAAEANAGFVALGQNSAATSTDVSGAGYLTGTGFSGTAVSVGNSSTNLYRRITNVADGAQDHDAVTVAQLKALKADLGSFTPTGGGNANYNVDGTLSVADAVTGGEAVSLGQMNQAISDSEVEYFSVDPNGDTSNQDNAGANGDNSMAIGHAAQTQGKSSLSIGHEARVTESDQATSVGYKTNAKADDSTAIGSESTVDDMAGVAMGHNAYSRGENSLALGTDAQTGAQNSGGGTTSDNAIAFGTSSRATNDDASALGHSATATGKKSAAIGFEAIADGAESAFATGTRANANAASAHAAGTDSVASATNAFASGTNATARGADSIASGTQAKANTSNAIAIGHEADSGFAGDPANAVPATGNTIAIGNGGSTVHGESSLAVGNHNRIGAEDASDPGNVFVAGNHSGAFGNDNTINRDNNFVVGNNNTITDEGVENTFVLGSNVTPSQGNSVILGQASSDRAATAETGAVIPAIHGGDISYAGFAGTGDPDHGVVSIGAVGTERQLINVAAGKISSDSTDGVNGSQLYAVMNEPLGFAGDTGSDVQRKLGKTLSITGGETDAGALTDDNIGVVANGTDGLAVKLAKDVDLGVNGSVTTGESVMNDSGLTVDDGAGNTMQLTKAGTTVTNGTGSTTTNAGGVTIAGGANGTVVLGNDGLDNGDNKIVNVADGTVAAGSADAVNGSQLFDTNQTVETLGDSVASGLGGNSSYDSSTGGLTTELSVDGATYTTVNDALDAVNTTANAGWNVADANGNSSNIGPDGKVTFNGDSNITVTESGADDAGKVAVALNKDVTLDSVTTGDTVIDNDGLSITNGPKFTSNGINADDQVISGVADGVVNDDAVNKGQLDIAAAAAASEVQAGTNVTSVDKSTATDGHAVYTVNAEGAKVTAGNGVDVASSASADNVTDYTVGLNQATKDSLANADSALQTVQTQVDGVDVKTLSKNDNTANFVSGQNIALSDDGNGGIEVATTDALTVDSVTAGDTVINSDGLTITNGPKFTSSGIDAGNQTISGVADGVDDDDAVNKSQLDQVSQGVNAGWNVTDAGGNSANIGPNGQVEFDGDSNIAVAQTGSDDDGKVEVSLNKDLDVDSVTTGDTVMDTDGLNIDDGAGNTTAVAATGTTVTDGTRTTTVGAGVVTVAGTNTVTVDGDAGTVDGLANTSFDPDNYTSGQAATEDQLKQVSDVANKGWNVSAQGQNASNVKPGDTVDFNNSDGNIEVGKTAGDNDVTFDLADDISVDSMTAGNTTVNNDGVTITGGSNGTVALGNDGLDNGGNKIVNVADGVDDGDAVNIGQLDQVTDAVTTAGMNFTGNDGGAVHRDLGQTLAITGEATTAGTFSGGNIKTVTDPNTGAVQIRIADSPKFGDITINVDDSGRITGVSRGIEGTDAVNKDQLDEVSQVASAGWNVSAQGANTSNVKPGDTVDFNNDDGNILVHKTNGSNDVTFDLADDIKVDSVSIGNDVMLDNMGLFIAGGPSISIHGIDAGNLKVTNVNPGTDPTDAVNKSQLDAVSDSVTQLADNAVQYDDGNKDKITLGGTSSTDGGKTGGTTISNVHRGDVSADSSDAVNGSQLYETNQNVAHNNDAINDLEKGQGGYYQVNDSAGKGKPEASGKDSTAGGAGAVASADNSTALGSGARAKAENSVALGAGSVADRDNAVSVGSGDQARQVTHVAAGTADTDAVNVSQLNDGMEEVTNWARSYTDRRFDAVNRGLNQVQRRANAGVASAMAMASLPQAYQPNQSAAAVSLGSFHGESALAVGVSTITDSGRYVLKLNATSNTRGDAGVGVGAAIVW